MSGEQAFDNARQHCSPSAQRTSGPGRRSPEDLGEVVIPCVGQGCGLCYLAAVRTSGISSILDATSARLPRMIDCRNFTLCAPTSRPLSTPSRIAQSCPRAWKGSVVPVVLDELGTGPRPKVAKPASAKFDGPPSLPAVRALGQVLGLILLEEQHLLVGVHGLSVGTVGAAVALGSLELDLGAPELRI